MTAPRLPLLAALCLLLVAGCPAALQAQGAFPPATPDTATPNAATPNAATPDTTTGTPLDLLRESRFWIRGTSTVNSFTCTVDTVRGSGRLPATRARANAAEAFAPNDPQRDPQRDPQTVQQAGTSDVAVDVPVQRFDCGNDRMTRDLKETLRAEAHPTIRFRLHDASVVRVPDADDGWYRLEALGHLTVAGTERLVRVRAWGRPVRDDVYRVHGCKVIKMTYFGVEPPTKFFGAVKVHDAIRVHFDLLAEAANTPTPASPPLALGEPPPCND